MCYPQSHIALEVEKLVTASRGQGLVTAADGLPALEVAAHTKEKEFVLERIATIFNTGMQHKWNERYYVDVFAGPGKCRIRGTNTEIEGSALLAAKVNTKFTNYYFADKDPDCLDALQKRIDLTGLNELSHVGYYPGEADEVVPLITKDLPPARNSLGLAVFDAWGWDFAFETLAYLTTARRLDLVVNFPIGNIKRNWDKELPMLDAFMNGTGYKKPFLASMRGEAPGEKPAQVLLDHYSDELQKIGYTYVKPNVVVDNSKRTTLYCLLFASKNERGADFWEKVTQRKESGQFRMPLGLG